MARSNRSNGAPDQALLTLEQDALRLASRLPELLVDARRVSQTVAHGIHGRRRPGSGETFWQFRTYEQTDAASLVDWRRSASSDRLFVREREWEAAHTIWLWPDLSPSMDYCSHIATVNKRDRALVLAFALSDLLARGGERIGLLGVSPPRLTRNVVERLAQDVIGLLGDGAGNESLPPAAVLSAFSDCVLISDFLEPIEELDERVAALAGQRVGGHLVQVLDPAEETLPFSGRTEFLGIETDDRLLADKVESLRDAYQQRMAAHRAALADLARQYEWSFLVHHTDRPAEEALLALYARLSGRPEAFAATTGTVNEITEPGVPRS